MSGPLEGVKIIEANRVTPGSLCTVMLADMGAEVIRIVEPRQRPTGEVPAERAAKRERARLANWVDRNKRSLALDLKKPEAQDAFKRLAADADVVVEGFRPGVLDRLGVGWSVLSELNPRLIYCALSGFGQDGPYRDFPAHDINYLSLAGVLNLMGEPGRPPAIPLNLVADYAGAAMHGALGVTMALFARSNTGRGQLVDVAYLDTTLSLLSAVPSMFGWFGGGVEPSRDVGTFDNSRPWYTTYETSDGKLLSIGCTEPWLYHNLCDAIERPDLKSAELGRGEAVRSATPEQAAARDELAAIFKTRTRDDWFEFLTRADVCVGKVYDVPEVFADPQVRHRGMAVEVTTSRGESVTQPGVAIKLSDTPGGIRNQVPEYGADTEDILAEIGYDTATIESMRAAGAC